MKGEQPTTAEKTEAARRLHGLPALAPHAAACDAGGGGGRAVLMNPLFLPCLPPAEPKPAPGGSVRASRAASARPACGRMRGRLRRRASRAMNPLFLPCLPPAERKPAPGGSVRASRAASAGPARGRMRGRLRRRAGRAYEPPLPAIAAAGSAPSGVRRQRGGFTGCQRSPRTRLHARQAAEEDKQGL